MIWKGESCDGSTIRNGTNESLIDMNNDRWTILSNDTIDINGQLAGYSANVVLLVYLNKTIYQSNNNGGWWGWINSNWILINDPILISQLISANGCIYTTSSCNLLF